MPAYRKRIGERFFLGPYEYKPVDVWVHAVSLGEVIAAIPLIDAMLAKNWSVLVTTMTPTGSERVQTHFANKVLHRYLPYDLPCVLKRFYQRIKPRVGVIMETELWPNLIYQAQAAQVPLVLANGRISDNSLQGYKKIKWLTQPILNKFAAILVQGTEDAQRYISLGARAERVQVAGNMKFDLQTSHVDRQFFSDLKKCWGASRVTVIAASTHEHEETQLLAQLRRLQQGISEVILLIAPRHPERFQEVYQLCRQSGFKTGLRSDRQTLGGGNEVVVIDSLGELLGLYQISDYAFVGGSLVPVGGHNVLEPIAMNVPVLSGEQVHNFKAICAELAAMQGILLVNSAKELIEAVLQLHADPLRRQQMVDNAAAVFTKNKGAVARHLQQIALLKEEPNGAKTF